ncbi:MAG: RNA polymerase factor sigma-54 [Clostridiales Family XIII bacterium]|jgi:RNA polymerase sigma-54 factor|nr:RNA polymerase factor sigma-54 [Clostridiales Family XIII bacterium]
MKLGYDLTIEQTQKMVMTPELIQAIQILQFNTQELETYLEEQLLTNPVLEAENGSDASDGHDEDEGQRDDERRDGLQPSSRKANEDFDWSAYLDDRDIDDVSYRHWEYGYKRDEPDFEPGSSSEVSLAEHLLFQLQFTDLKKSHKQIGKYIIETLDHNGYMTQTAEEMAACLGVPVSRVESVISAIQGFDPVGVCAADLGECLRIQLETMGVGDPAIFRVVDNYLHDLAANRLSAIAKALGVPVKEVQRIADVIKSLEPKPGRQFASPEETKFIVPDVIVETHDGERVVTVNDGGAPRLTVSRYYRQILHESDKDSNISKFLTGRLNSALWLIKSLEQRRQTIYNVACAIVKRQKEFFDQGPKHMKPLTLKQIADDVGIHESTVSRSINGKYLQCSRGMYEMKRFFTSGVSLDEGGGLSSASIKAMLKEIVDTEDPSMPFSDRYLAEVLNRRGINISRRTVAKYREAMKMPPSSMRKRY